MPHVLRWLVPVFHAWEVWSRARASDFIYARDLKSGKSNPNMAAVGIFRGRLTLSCLRRNFHLPGVTSTRKFFINTTYGKKNVSGAQYSSFRQKVRICAAIDRVSRDRKLPESQLEFKQKQKTVSVSLFVFTWPDS